VKLTTQPCSMPRFFVIAHSVVGTQQVNKGTLT